MASMEIKALHDKMEQSYERGQISGIPKNYLPAVCEFAKELATNPLLKNERQAIAQLGKEDMASFCELKKRILTELNNTRILLSNYKETIPYIAYFLDDCHLIEKNRLAESWELAFDLNGVLLRTVQHIKFDTNRNHSELLKKLVKLDEKNCIVEYIFAPSLKEWDYEYQLLQRTQKNSIWYSVHALIQLHMLYDLKIRTIRQYELANNKQESSAYYLGLEFELFDRALKEISAEKTAQMGFDVAEYKIYQHRVWTYLQPKLLTNNNSNQAIETAEVFTYRFVAANDLRKGLLSNGTITHELVGNSAMVLYLAIKKKNLSVDEAGESLPDNQTPKRQQVNNALRVIKNGVLKRFSKDEYIKSKSGVISVNYITRLIQ